MDASCASDESAILRTAKSCGPDAPTLASSWRKQFPPAMVANKPGHQGEREVSRKTIACGNAGCPGATVVTNARATYSTRAAAGATGTRHSPLPSWGSARSPLGVAPRPLLGERFRNNSGAMRRGNAKVCFAVIACDKRGAFVQGSAAKQSILSSWPHGLLRCARNDGILVV
jgi:hypothetical protein